MNTAKIQNMIRVQTQQDDALEAIFKKYLELDTDKHDANPGYKAWASSALVTCISIANLLLSIKQPESGRSFRAMQDLTYALGANDFWSKNAAVLVPILTISMNAHKDYIAMMVEADQFKEYATYDTLIAGTKAMPLAIFSMILYLVGGPALMATTSLPLTMELAPYLLG